MKRFYKSVTVGEIDAGFGIALDGKPLTTPGRVTLALPTRALAEAIAEEWRGQAEEVVPGPLTRLANTAAERTPHRRGETAAQILEFGKSDLLCYRAEGPDELVARQGRGWNPLLDWARERHGAALSVTAGIGFVEQPAEALLALERAVWAHDDFALTALHAAAALAGSLVLALALVDGRLIAAEAYVLARIDETFQAEKWGVDAEAAARAAYQLAELEAAERFLRLSRP